MSNSREQKVISDVMHSFAGVTDPVPLVTFEEALTLLGERQKAIELARYLSALATVPLEQPLPKGFDTRYYDMYVHSNESELKKCDTFDTYLAAFLIDARNWTMVNHDGLIMVGQMARKHLPYCKDFPKQHPHVAGEFNMRAITRTTESMKNLK